MWSVFSGKHFRHDSAATQINYIMNPAVGSKIWKQRSKQIKSKAGFIFMHGSAY